ncbi:MAG: lipid A deacylase LpxR family protein [Candidatus Sedimenticola sp. 20ELBAFRAG]
MNRAVLIILAALCFTSLSASAEEHNAGGTLYLDQDLFSADNQDRNYTQGLGVAWFGKRVTSDYFLTNTARKKVNDWWGLDQAFDKEPSHSFMLGLTAFTPDDLSASAPIYDDRPYASLLAFTSNRVALDSTETSSLRTGFTLGILGLDLGRGLQTWLHDKLGGDRPQGWHNQISDGGEPTFLYSVERRDTLFKGYDSWVDWDISSSVGGNIGYYTNASLGLDLRMGRIKTSFHEHNPAPFDPFNKALKRTSPTPSSGKDAYLWFRYRANLFAYNALLQGQFRDSAVTFDSDRLHRLVHEFGAGVTWDLSNYFTLTLAQYVRSSDIKGPNERDHHYGGIYLTWRTDN